MPCLKYVGGRTYWRLKHTRLDGTLHPNLLIMAERSGFRNVVTATLTSVEIGARKQRLQLLGLAVSP